MVTQEHFCIPWLKPSFSFPGLLKELHLVMDQERSDPYPGAERTQLLWQQAGKGP